MMTPYGFPLGLYHCLLDEQPHYLVPTRLLEEQEPAAGLIVNPNCWFSWHGPLPADKGVRIAFAQDFCPSDCVVWVDSPATGTVWPFWVGDEYYSYLSELAPGYPAPVDLPEQALWVLRAANILVDYHHEGRRRQNWLRGVRERAPLFERGYVPLSDLIHPFHIGALRRYYRYHTRAGSFPLGDNQVSRRYAAHNETVARFYHHQLTSVVSDMAASLVKPSYVYFAAYQGDSELAWHTDREQCEYSITICIDASPEPEEQNPWPLDLQTADGLLRVWQYIGDGLLYRGRYIPHAREPLPSGHTSSSLMFHYVDEAFDGPLD
jgi:hypothetical protein